MNKKNKIYLSLLAIGTCAAMLNACKKSDDTPAAAPNTSAYGFVRLVDEFGNRKTAGGSANITVKTDSITSPLTASTDTSGKFVFNNLPSGTYDFSFSGPSTSVYKRLSVAYVAGPRPGYLGQVSLYETSTASFGGTSLSVTIDSINPPYSPTNKGIRITATASNSNAYAPNRSQYSYTFISKTSDVSSSKNTYNMGSYATYSGSAAPYTANPSSSISVSQLKTMGFAKGDKVYAIIYMAPSSYYYYTDYNSQKTIYCGMSAPSNVAFAILP